MQQYFIKENLKVNDLVNFTSEQQKHIKQVLRMKEGSVIKVVDASETGFLATISYQQNQVFARIIEPTKSNKERIKVTLIQGMIKGERWDMCIQKACEFGVHQIIPLISNRTIVKLHDKVEKKLERYNKIALEACEQCKRDHLVEVTAPISMKQLHEYKSELNLFAYEDADSISQNIKDILLANKEVQSVTIVIGSEGGFDKQECENAQAQGYEMISLGKRIYRAETAAMAAINTTLVVLD
ncbi:16S rRNA (uracil1498-N3)-methyltransferase [Breznakia blatticola]|uniref:Ribosomal RNA small subunit methyltransferase E n=1 Tax=Breznakia blatticola TaxID=1754012 RepID=A0A4R7ZAW5_9FIRM|nr:RsmE family RNA methyltransferase [Breznakia blatticola]TDW14579.1 16S rRNA (uracil1498-N3)-methyltransferase [Breznakia blatticola]